VQVLAIAWVEAIQQIVAVRDSIEFTGNLGLSELEIIHFAQGGYGQLGRLRSTFGTEC